MCEFKFNIGDTILVKRCPKSSDPAKEWFNSKTWLKDCIKLVGNKFIVLSRYDFNNESTYGNYYGIDCKIPGINNINLPEIILKRISKVKESKWKSVWKD